MMGGKTGAESVIEALVAAGVRHLFTLSGNQIMSIYDATIGRDIALIHTRHEAAAVHMADGWGRLTETPGVALLTAGPGHCNAIGALYMARMAESPVVLLSGHSPLSQLGRGAFQEMDQVTMASPVTKAAWRVEDANQLADDIAAALDLAQSGRPGPVHLSLPVDVLQAPVAARPSGAPAQDRAGPSLPSVADADILLMVEMLAAARRPLILAGPAMSRPQRWAAVAHLAAVTGIPALPMTSPRGVNDPWLHMATHCLSEADGVLLVGKKRDFALRFGEPPFFDARVIFLEIDAEAPETRRTLASHWVIRADPTQVVQQLAAAAQGRPWQNDAWRARVLAAREEVPATWETLRTSVQKPIHPLRVCQAVQPFLDAGALYVSDGGEFGQWVQAGLEAERRLINGPSGAIGSAIPLALAAKLTEPGRPVFAFSGDGAFGYHALEFDTALRYNLPVVAIVGNDARWNAEVQIQIRDYGPDRTVGCELRPTRYDQVVAALGGYGERVEEPADLEPAIERALASGLPACLNVMIEGVAAPTLRRTQ